MSEVPTLEDNRTGASRVTSSTSSGDEVCGPVFCIHLDGALHVAEGLRAGRVWSNGWDACDITMPFGGSKQSGFGRESSLHALEKHADLKAVTIAIGQARA